MSERVRLARAMRAAASPMSVQHLEQAARIFRPDNSKEVENGVEESEGEHNTPTCAHADIEDQVKRTQLLSVAE